MQKFIKFGISSTTATVGAAAGAAIGKQLTGREHYTKFSKYAKNKNWVDTANYFVNNPDSITTDGKFALLSAVYFWNSKELYKIADKQNENNTNEIVKQITKKVNGGESALSDRQQAFHKIQSDNIFEEF